MQREEQDSLEIRQEACRIRRKRQIVFHCFLLAVGLILVSGWILKEAGIIGTIDTNKDNFRQDEAEKSDNNNNEQVMSGIIEGSNGTETQGGTLEDPRKSLCIVLDAGHGGKDPGTLWGEIYEKDINLAIAQKLQILLEEAGYQVVMTRTGDDRTVLKERVRIAEENNAAAFVSIHQNALKNDTVTEGIQVFYNQGSNVHNEKLAQKIYEKLLEETGARDKGMIKSEELYILNHATVPACLVETGFLTSTTERQKLLDDDYQQKIAEGVAKGILSFLEN